MTCDTWFEELKLESNTTQMFLTPSAGETQFPNIDKGSEGGVVYDFLGAYENNLCFVWG